MDDIDPSAAAAEASDREVAVVTGGASGLGRGLAEEFARRGMDVVLLDRDAGRAEAEAEALAAAHGVVALGRGVDIADPAQLADAAELVDERFGRVDLVLSNVGVQLFGAVESFTDDEWRWILDINVIGAARTARTFLPLLRRASNPRLAFTTSSSLLDPASRLGAYQATKFAVWGLAETLRLELADEVSVSVLFPSGMLSRHLETSTEAQPDHIRREIGAPEDFEAMIASNPDMASMPISPEEAAARSADALLRGERYVITHGDLVAAVARRDAALRRAAEQARSS
jgi:NAD(P)-dependent dehydrogenase (short-subunit alcohol dehydrogenase family)